MIFKTMKAEDVRKAIAGQQNVLVPALKAHEAYFRHLACPSCGQDVDPFVNPKQPYKKGEVLPNFLARCKVCKVEFSPSTGIQVTMPEP